MAGNLTDPAENLLLDTINGVTGTVVTTPLKLKLVTVMGTDSTAGTEVSGGSYAAQTIAFSAASGGSSSNNAAITFSNMPAVTVVGFEIVDSAGTPKRLWWIPAGTSRTVSAGDSITVAVGAIAVSLD